MLTVKYQAQLNSWLGHKSAKYDLLYRASRDGCTLQAYHAKCDNHGPLLVVAKNTANYIFGGYTSLVIQPAAYNTYRQDDKAFLFCLMEAGKESPERYKVAAGTGGIYDLATWGPNFTNNAGHRAFHFFSANCNETNGTFNATNNAVCQWGSGYQTNGRTSANFCGNNFVYYDIEVYQVQDMKLYPPEKAWRKGSNVWDGKVIDRLKAEVRAFSPPSELRLPCARILLLGQSKAGKSSFFNTLNSVFKGHVTAQAVCGCAPHSLTTVYRVYRLRSGEDGVTLNFRLCDTMGIEEDGGLHVTDVPYLLDGNVQDRYQFNPAVRITPQSPGFLVKPEFKDKIHCVAFVVDSETMLDMASTVRDKLTAMRAHINQRGIPLFILLTKIDKICEFVQEDTRKVFLSPSVEEKIVLASDVFGVPRSQVLPVRNYESELELEPAIDILALTALRQMARYTTSYFDEVLDDGEVVEATKLTKAG